MINVNYVGNRLKTTVGFDTNLILVFVLIINEKVIEYRSRHNMQYLDKFNVPHMTSVI